MIHRFALTTLALFFIAAFSLPRLGVFFFLFFPHFLFCNL
jgi:hypothetical protein